MGAQHGSLHVVDAALLERSQAVREAFTQTGRTLCCAESCTGGLLAGAITEVSGSSVYFKGGVVSYWAEVKAGVLGVPQQIIDEHGVVSRECAEAMAAGAARVLGCDYALATTGIAGPGGEEPGKPVGTVWVGLCTPQGAAATCIQAQGNRQQVRREAVLTALDLLLAAL